MLLRLQLLFVLVLLLLSEVDGARRRARRRNKRPIRRSPTTTTYEPRNDYEICPADTGFMNMRCFHDSECFQGGVKLHAFCVGESDNRQGYCCQPAEWHVGGE
ncbi:hypothetical protein M3Y97_00119100 [Aphelenchoides bicaudatus]|nr:hypothetical protein M3Y97_00119100 [Aphelenchoides bicaudatus]